MGTMRALLPDAADDVDLHQHYARHWLEPGGIRANFISSVDGAVTIAGRSRGLQTPGDNRVFAVLRDLADAVVVGAGTARVEGYGVVDLSARRRAIRRQLGLDEALPTVVVSHSLQLDPGTSLFAGDGPRTVVVTRAGADRTLHERLDAVADVLVCGDQVVDLAAACRALAERGLTRLLCEGGPTLFAGLAHAGLVDELCLTVAPLLAGPGAGRIVAGTSWPLSTAGRNALRLEGLLEEDEALFCRYRLLP